jgi:hypothetical protein
MSPQPGISHRAQNVPKLMFIGTSTGMVSATTRPPTSAARSAAVSWRGTRAGTDESTVSTFQLIDRPAAADMAATSSISSSANWSRPPSNAPSRNVPSCSPTAAHRASSSSREAWREATGRPSPSLWVDDSVVERPSPPASIDRWSRATMAASCSLVASWPTASAPIT